MVPKEETEKPPTPYLKTGKVMKAVILAAGYRRQGLYTEVFGKNVERKETENRIKICHKCDKFLSKRELE